MTGLFLYYSLLSFAAIFFSLFLPKKQTLNFITLVLFSILIFLPYFFISGGVRDIELFESVGFLSSRRADIYYIDSNHGLYPYFPFLSLVLGPVYLLSQAWSLPFLNLWRVITLTSLLVSAFLIYKILTLGKSKERFNKVLVYIFSPITLFPVVFHAHFDIILVLFLLFAIYFSFFRNKKIFYSAVFLALSILAKTWSIMFLPLFIKEDKISQKLYFLAIFFFVIFAITAFYIRFWHSSFFWIFQAVSGYVGSGSLHWGGLGLVSLFINVAKIFSSDFRHAYLILLFSIVYILIFLKKFDILKGSFFIILSLFVFTIGWAVQYIFWVWPFLVIRENISNIRWYSLLALPYLLVAYIFIVWDIKNDFLLVVSSLPIWLFSVKLWYTLLRER